MNEIYKIFKTLKCEKKSYKTNNLSYLDDDIYSEILSYLATPSASALKSAMKCSYICLKYVKFRHFTNNDLRPSLLKSLEYGPHKRVNISLGELVRLRSLGVIDNTWSKRCLRFFPDIWRSDSILYSLKN